MLFSGSACLSGDDLAEGQQLFINFIVFYLLRGGLQEPLWPTNARNIYEQLSSHHATQA